MQMTHKYPFGAIKSEEPIILGLLGQTLYRVYGLGSSSSLTVMENVRNLHTSKAAGFRVLEYTDATRADSPWDSSCFLGDINIGAHHNHHYLFHDRADAEAYLAWAKENTPEIRKDSFWDDYDYIYGDDQ